MPTAPFTSAEVVERYRILSEAFRAKGAPVIYIRVDLGGFLELPVDASHHDPNAPPPRATASEIAPCRFQVGDLLITKRHWGAFARTELEQQLKQRGIETVVLGGITTNFGVEIYCSARYRPPLCIVKIEDACSSLDAHPLDRKPRDVSLRREGVRIVENVGDYFSI